MTQPPSGAIPLPPPPSSKGPPYPDPNDGQAVQEPEPEPRRASYNRLPATAKAKPTIPESVQHNLGQGQTEGVPPDLIATIAKEVLKELEQRKQQDPSTYIPAHFYPSPRPDAPLSPTASSTNSQNPNAPLGVHTPPSPPKQAEYVNGSPPRRAAAPPPPRADSVSSQSPRSGDSSPQSRRASVFEAEQRQERPSSSDDTWEKIWGKFFDDNGKPTAKLSELLRGMAEHMIESYEPKKSLVVTPDKMQRYYRETHIANEPYPWHVIFDDTVSCIGRMYRELGCEHHLVQEAGEVHEKPDIPGLTANGFRHWATLMVLAHPDAAHARLQRIVREFPINNPDDRTQRFPKELPRSLFPKEPNMQIRHIMVEAIEEHARVSIHAASPSDTPRQFGSMQSNSGHSLRSAATAPAAPTAVPAPPTSTAIPLPPPPGMMDRPPSRSQQSEASTTSEASNIERERKPYGTSSIPASCAIDDTNPTPNTARPIEREQPTPNTARPIERERKPYSSREGEGRSFDMRASDEDLAPRSPVSNNGMAQFPPMPTGNVQSPMPSHSISVPPPPRQSSSQPPPPMPSIRRTNSNSAGARPINIPSHGPPRVRVPGDHGPPPLAASATFAAPGARSVPHAHRSSVSGRRRAYSPPPGAQFRSSEGDLAGGPPGGMSGSFDAGPRSSWDGRDERRFEYRPHEDTLPPPGPPPSSRNINRGNSPRRPSVHHGAEEDFYQRPRRETTGMRPGW